MSVTAGTGFVGVRSPRHPIARQLLEAAGLPIAAPSANRFGHVSPTSAEHVMYDLGEEEIIVLKDNLSISGGCAVGIESTVCRVSKEGDIVSILRCGAVTSEDVSAALSKSGNEKLKNISVVIENEKALIKKHSSSSSKEHSSSTSSSLKETVNDTDTDAVFGAVAPGQMIKHYAPDIPTFVVSLKADPVSGSNVSLNPNPNSYRNTEELTCVDSSSATVIKVNEAFVIDFGGQLEYMSSACSIYCDLSPNEQPEEACNRIFEVLRQAETSSLTSSAIGSNSTNPTPKVVLLPDLRAAAEKSEMVRALWERLHRAASGTFVC
jgi:L-threonylcarbamoyladenylate synthase